MLFAREISHSEVSKLLTSVLLLSRHSFSTALIQQDKSSSSVKLPNIEKKSSPVGDDARERFHARNWKALSKKEIQKLPPQQRSKYLAVRYRCCRFACY